MWRAMTIEQEQAWHNGYFSPTDVRETEHGVEWFDSAHMCIDTIEKATRPDPSGNITVYVVCTECTRIVSSHPDSIL